MLMTMIPVKSSHISCIGYDEAEQTLRVEFNTGTYDYLGVPKTVYETIMKAESKGQSLRETVLLKDYHYNRVKED